MTSCAKILPMVTMQLVNQYIIVGTILVACLGYATFRLVKSWRSAMKCKDYKCSGCPFFEKCEKNKKKVEKKFGGTK